MIFLRPHNLDHTGGLKNIKMLLGDHIRVLGFNECNDINTALPEMDALISDYSSLYYDFLLLDRPCIFVPYDLEAYVKDRGLLFDDYELWAPGIKVYDQTQFLEALDDAMHHDSYASQRALIRKVIHYYQTDDSCHRIIEEIGGS